MNKKMMQYFLLLLICFNFADAKTPETNYIVKRKTVTNPLYFNSSILPLDNYTLVSQISGRIVTKPFSYGQVIKKGQLLFTISSPQLAKDYQGALANYLKAKDNYHLIQSKFSGTDDLWKAGIIAKNEYLAEKSRLASEHIVFSQALYRLKEILKKANVNDNLITQTNIDNFSQVEKKLQLNFDAVEVRAPQSGIALKPLADTASKQKTNPIFAGSEIKSGQALLTIGDLSGLSLDIEVSEVDINKIKLQQEVVITGVAFPDFTLHGKIAQIASQAQSGTQAALPHFLVKIKVPVLTPEQAAIIHVGMSAKVSVAISHEDAIDVPIAAVYQQGGKAMVDVIREGKQLSVMVTPGETSLSRGIIQQGLKENDQIIIHKHSA